MKFREIESIILQNGWYQVKQKGSHHQYKHPTKPGKVTIPEHGGDLNPDTVKSNFETSGALTSTCSIYINGGEYIEINLSGCI